MDVCQIHQNEDLNELYNFFSKLKNKKINIKDVFFGKDKSLPEYFEQNYNSTTKRGIYKIGHDAITLMKHMVFYDRCHERKIF